LRGDEEVVEGRLASFDLLVLKTSTSTSHFFFLVFSFSLQTRIPHTLQQIRALNSGTFGFVELCADRATGQQVAVKFIERGDKVSFEFFSSNEKEKNPEKKLKTFRNFQKKQNKTPLFRSPSTSSERSSTTAC